MSQSYSQVEDLTAHRIGVVGPSTLSSLSGRYASTRIWAAQRHQPTPPWVDQPRCLGVQLDSKTQTLVFTLLSYR